MRSTRPVFLRHVWSSRQRPSHNSPVCGEVSGRNIWQWKILLFCTTQNGAIFGFTASSGSASSQFITVLMEDNYQPNHTAGNAFHARSKVHSISSTSANSEVSICIHCLRSSPGKCCNDVCFGLCEESFCLLTTPSELTVMCPMSSARVTLS